MPEPDSNPPTPATSPGTQSPNRTREEEKLDLEITSLEQKNKWYVVWQPMLAILLGIAGLSFTVLQGQCQRTHEQKREQTNRELERTARFQNQIRLNSDELIRSAKDDRQTAS